MQTRPPRFTTTGSHGSDVVFLHAIGLDRGVWDGVVDEFPDGYRLHAWDLRGFGTADADRPSIIADEADALAEQLSDAGIAKAHLVGLSYGGVVAQQMALRHPERVRSLGLVATLARAARAGFLDRAASAEAGGHVSFVEPTLERWFTDDSLRAVSEGVRYARTRLQEVQIVNWAAGWRALAEVDILDSLDRVSVPTVLVAGELDGSTTPESMAAMADRIRDSRLEVVAGTSHMVPLEAPARVARDLHSTIAAADERKARAR